MRDESTQSESWQVAKLISMSHGAKQKIKLCLKVKGTQIGSWEWTQSHRKAPWRPLASERMSQNVLSRNVNGSRSDPWFTPKFNHFAGAPSLVDINQRVRELSCDRRTDRQTRAHGDHNTCYPHNRRTGKIKLEGHSVERMYLRQRCFDGWVNKTMLKPRIAAAAGRANYAYVGFSRRKFRVPALIRCRRKQSGFGIRTIIRIGLKN